MALHLALRNLLQPKGIEAFNAFNALTFTEKPEKTETEKDTLGMMDDHFLGKRYLKDYVLQ